MPLKKRAQNSSKNASNTGVSKTSEKSDPVNLIATKSKKTAPKAVKKTTKKAVAKRVTKKATKKVTKKVAKKTVAKKTVAKKTVAKKTVAKKVPRKTAKKTVVQDKAVKEVPQIISKVEAQPEEKVVLPVKKAPEKKEAPKPVKVEQKKQPKVKKDRRKLFVRIGVIVVLLILVGLIKNSYETRQKNKKFEAYLAEAELFIKTEKFSRAEETLEYAEGLIPNDEKVLEMNAFLRTQKEVSSLERQISIQIKQQEWDAVDKGIGELRAIDPDNSNISLYEGKAAASELTQKVVRIERQLEEAQDKRAHKEILKRGQQLLALDPENVNAFQWRLTIQKAERDLDAQVQRARKLYERAVVLDKKKYDQQVIHLVKGAYAADPLDKYSRYLRKVENYPRDIYYPKDYSSLQEAIDLARSFDTVYIESGNHFSSIVINKEVKLVGAPSNDSIVHCSGEEACVVFVGPKGILNVTGVLFKHSSKQESESSYSVVTVQGKADFNSSVIYDSSGHGIDVLDGGQVKLDSCRIENNSWDGLAVSGQNSSAIVESCIIARNSHNGVDTWDQGQVQFITSISELNGKSGAVSTSKGVLTLSRATLRNNTHAGLYVMNDGVATAEHCEFSNNEIAGAYGDQKSNASFNAVKLIKNKVAGIYLKPGTKWSGLDSVEYKDNEGQNLWVEEEIVTLDDIMDDREVVNVSDDENTEKGDEDSDLPSVEEWKKTTEGELKPTGE